MTSSISYNDEISLATNEIEQEQNEIEIERILKDNHEYKQSMTTSKRELRYLKKTICLMQNEINRLHEEQQHHQKKSIGKFSKLMKLVGVY
jgi:hypothetical protein